MNNRFKPMRPRDVKVGGEIDVVSPVAFPSDIDLSGYLREAVAGTIVTIVCEARHDGWWWTHAIRRVPSPSPAASQQEEEK